MFWLYVVGGSHFLEISIFQIKKFYLDNFQFVRMFKDADDLKFRDFYIFGSIMYNGMKTKQMLVHVLSNSDADLCTTSNS